MTDVPRSEETHVSGEENKKEPHQCGEDTETRDDILDQQPAPQGYSNDHLSGSLGEDRRSASAAPELPSWVSGPLERALKYAELAFGEIASLVAKADEFDEARRVCERALDKIRISSYLQVSQNEMRALLAAAEDALAYLCAEAPDATALREAGERVDRARDALARHLVERAALRLELGKYSGARWRRQ